MTYKALHNLVPANLSSFIILSSLPSSPPVSVYIELFFSYLHIPFFFISRPLYMLFLLLGKLTKLLSPTPVYPCGIRIV